MFAHGPLNAVSNLSLSWRNVQPLSHRSWDLKVGCFSRTSLWHNNVRT